MLYGNTGCIIFWILKLYKRSWSTNWRMKRLDTLKHRNTCCTSTGARTTATKLVAKVLGSSHRETVRKFIPHKLAPPKSSKPWVNPDINKQAKEQGTWRAEGEMPWATTHNATPITPQWSHRTHQQVEWGPNQERPSISHGAWREKAPPTDLRSQPKCGRTRPHASKIYPHFKGLLALQDVSLARCLIG